MISFSRIASRSFGAVAALGLAWAPTLVTAYLWSIPMGIGAAGFITAANAITQQESPPDMRSRLMALQAVAFLGSTPIGGPITGVIADVVSPEWSLAYGGVIALLCAGGVVVIWLTSDRRLRPVELPAT